MDRSEDCSMRAFLELLGTPPASLEEEEKVGKDLLSSARKEYLELSAAYTEARDAAAKPTWTPNSRLLLTNHLKAEKKLLCAGIKASPTEEQLEKRLAKSRQLRKELHRLRERKQELISARTTKLRTSKKLDVKTSKRLRDLVGLADKADPMAALEALPEPLYVLCSSLTAATGWIDYDVEVEEVKEGSSRKRSREQMEDIPSVMVKVKKEDGSYATMIIKYSEKLNLLYLDESNTKPVVVEALKKVDGHGGHTPHSQLERFQYSQSTVGETENEGLRVEAMITWQWLQHLGGISEMPLLTASSLLGKKQFDRMSATTFLDTLRSS